MSRDNKTTRYGEAPPERVRHEPPSRGVGAVPNPRRPRLVRDVGGAGLNDLFALFPDLPRPPRPARRLRSRAEAALGRRSLSAELRVAPRPGKH
jgi:hypothetical protein